MLLMYLELPGDNACPAGFALFLVCVRAEAS